MPTNNVIKGSKFDSNEIMRTHNLFSEIKFVVSD